MSQRIPVLHIYYTMSQENLLNLLRQLTSSDLATLQTQDMRKWLAQFQQETHSITTLHPRFTLAKSKPIRKFMTKDCLKRYITKRMGSIVARSVAKALGNSLPRTPPCSIVEVPGGKSKFKKGTSRRKTSKLLKFKRNLREAWGSSSHEELNCPICLQSMISPALTLCGHVFCWECLDESLLFSPNCPNCRENIKFSEPIVCSLLDNLIRAKISLNEAEVPHFEERLGKYQAWHENRVLAYDKLQAGTLIDVRDTECIWCQGTIVKVYRKTNAKLQRKAIAVLVHYNRWNKLYNEIIDVPSHRLAPLHCFSGRVDIPRYNLSEQTDNMRGSVVSGPSLRIEFAHPLDFDVQMLSDSDGIIESSLEDSENEEDNEEYEDGQDENGEEEQQEQEQQEQQPEHSEQIHSAPLGSSDADNGRARAHSRFFTFLSDYRREGLQLRMAHSTWPNARNIQEQLPEPPLSPRRVQSQPNLQQSSYHYSSISSQNIERQSQQSRQRWESVELAPFRVAEARHSHEGSESKDNEGERKNKEAEQESPGCQHYQ